MNIYFWSPFISEVATIKTVINTIKSMKDFSKDKNLNLNLINAFGEWDKMENIISKLNIDLINFNKIDFSKFLPNYGYFASRSRYIIIFISSFFKLHSILKKNKTDYLICYLITSLPLILIILFNYKSKVILRISGLPKLNIFRSILWKLASKKIYLVTCPTKETLKKIQSLKIFDPNKIEFLPEPVICLKEFREKKDEKILEDNFDKRDSIVSIGRLTKQKNQLFLIKCMEKIFFKHRNLKLFIIGDGELKDELREIINKLNLNNRIFLLGYKKNVFNYLKSCKCFILSSLWEDPGYVLIEAAMANATIISSNCPNGPSEILNDGHSGYLYENNSEKDFIKKFEDFIKSSEEEIYKKKISAKKGIKTYTNFYHYKFLEKYLSI